MALRRTGHRAGSPRRAEFEDRRQEVYAGFCIDGGDGGGDSVGGGNQRKGVPVWAGARTAAEVEQGRA